jgi:hypothetical protein
LTQGHSKNPACYGFDGLDAVFAEIFAGLSDSLADTVDHGEGGVSDAGECSGSGPDAATILVHGYVADVVQFVVMAQ